jgi:hypothetical protein
MDSTRLAVKWIRQATDDIVTHMHSLTQEDYTTPQFHDYVASYLKEIGLVPLRILMNGSKAGIPVSVADSHAKEISLAMLNDTRLRIFVGMDNNYVCDYREIKTAPAINDTFRYDTLEQSALNHMREWAVRRRLGGFTVEAPEFRRVTKEYLNTKQHLVEHPRKDDLVKTITQCLIYQMDIPAGLHERARERTLKLGRAKTYAPTELERALRTVYPAMPNLK